MCHYLVATLSVASNPKSVILHNVTFVVDPISPLHTTVANRTFTFTVHHTAHRHRHHTQHQQQPHSPSVSLPHQQPQTPTKREGRKVYKVSKESENSVCE